jgi:hypothetical protein
MILFQFLKSEITKITRRPPSPIMEQLWYPYPSHSYGGARRAPGTPPSLLSSNNVVEIWLLSFAACGLDSYMHYLEQGGIQ